MSSLQRGGQIALIVALSALGIWIVSDFLPALAWGVVVAIAIWPLFERLRPRHGSQTGAALLFTLLVFVVLVVPLVVLGVQIGREAGDIMQWTREVERNGMPVPDWIRELPLVGSYIGDWWQAELAEPRSALNLLGRLDRNWVIEFTRILGVQLLHRLTILVFTFLTLFFLFRDGTKLVEQASVVIERLFGATGTRLGPQVLVAVRATVNGLVLVGFGEGLILGIAYALTGVPHAVTLGAATGILATVPFGAPVIFIGGAIYLSVESHLQAAIALLAVGFGVVFVADHFLRPILIGGGARVPFLWVLLGIFGGLETFGLLGLFLGPTVIATLLAVWREWARPDPLHA